MKASALVGVAIALVLAGGAAVVARTTGGEARSGERYRGSTVAKDVRLPQFALRDWDGTRLSGASLRGKVVLVTFLESRCKEACPIIADQIGLGLARLEAHERRDVVAVAISTQPRDDTRASVRRFLRNHRVLGTLHYLIGTEAQLRPVWRAFAVASALDSGDADVHSAPVRVFDRRHRWVTTLHPRVDLTAANLAHDVRLALRDASLR